jgi:hypothetical protein
MPHEKWVQPYTVGSTVFSYFREVKLGAGARVPHGLCAAGGKVPLGGVEKGSDAVQVIAVGVGLPFGRIQKKLLKELTLPVLFVGLRRGVYYLFFFGPFVFLFRPKPSGSDIRSIDFIRNPLMRTKRTFW